MARSPHVNTAQASSDELLKIAESCGFEIFHGAKHDKVKTVGGVKITQIPRHGKKLFRPTVRKIVEALNKFGANISFT